MSADNWTACPRCKKRAGDAWNKLPGGVRVRMPSNLRQDYEFWLTDAGEFGARFSARCEVCGWSFSFKHNEKAEVGD